MEKTGQFRFTPPTHTILAFRQAIQEFYAEGGLTGRERRYKDNRAVLKKGMAEFGFKELVPEKHAGHIITCFYYPKHPKFSFETFYQKLSDIGWYLFVQSKVMLNICHFRPSYLPWEGH
jgi:2-aminoethylphosphonate-pyruvate transaminase